MTFTYAWRPGDYLIAVGRISDSQQKTIPEQYGFCDEGAARVGLSIPVDGYYSDIESRSNDLAARTDLNAAYERLEDVHCRGIVVWTDSRLLGDARQALDIMENLTDNDCRLFTKTAEIDVATLEGQLIGMIKGHLNRVEVERLRERVKDTHMAKARKGRLISRPPYAIKVVPLVDAPCGGACKGNYLACNDQQSNIDLWHGELSDKNTVWIWNQETLPHLRYMYELLASNKTLWELQLSLRAQGIRVPERIITRSKTNVGKMFGGGEFSIKQLGDIAKNEFYKGTFRWNMSNVVRKKVNGQKKKNVAYTDPEMWVVAAHVLGPIVDVNVWADANLNMERRANKRRANNRKYPPRLFDDLIKCGRCGWGMSLKENAYVRNDGARTYVYTCNGYANIYGGCSQAHSIAENTLDYYILGVPITGRGRRPPELDVTFARVSDGADALAAIARIDTLLADLDGQEAAVERLYIKKGKSEAWREEEERQIDQERQAALAERLRMEAVPRDAIETSSVPIEIGKMGSLLRNESIPMVERQNSLGRLIECIYIDRPSIRVVTRQKAA